MNEIDTEALYERVSAWIANAENNLERPGIPSTAYYWYYRGCMESLRDVLRLMDGS